MVMTFVLAFSLISTSIPVLIYDNANAENITSQVSIAQDGTWLKIQDDQITVLVPSSGKPMFLWWYSNDTANAYVQWLLDFHPSYLPFNAAQWNLTGPVKVTKEDGASYLSFNFTLVNAPPAFNFAEGNVIVRCRFYTTPTTENVYGLYDYSVMPDQLKMDLVVQNWDWNIDKLNSLFAKLQSDYGISTPQTSR
jgi:hypothetical protein